ncbi:hypothetical protein [Pseudomonas sp. CHM02]|uniref:hypothetical protein n=1 Tax=Pseudomonas sp. CHM02 TaxID=1463662 RepID=UPI00046E55DA|nr:hypothetical protein [Pseudomonas sp. CHM02]
MSKPIQTVEELDAVLHWRGKHAQAIKERDALQQLLTAADERASDLLIMLRMAWVDTHVTGEDCRRIDAALKPAEDRNEPNCLLCLDRKTVPSNLLEGHVMDCPDCCGEEG